MHFPSVCPEIPVTDMAAALAYYRDQLGFGIDWSAEDIGLACASRGDTRIFLTTAEYRAHSGVRGPVLLWLNLDNRGQVDALYSQWHAAGATIEAPPELQPYKLYEFFAQDPDGNQFRVFYDTAWEQQSDNHG
jgi:uncharacterized glyoxalase superfamily protein PhnB